MKALDGLSTLLLRHPRLRRDPAGVALGFWLRRANLARLEEEFLQQKVPGRRVAAGMVFHIAPGNVDTMFMYSWALSFLAGNTNIVRLTSERSPLMSDLLESLNQALAAEPVALAGNLFVSYSHDEATTAFFSQHCDTRIVWGGDETIRRIRAIPLNPHASERAFSSKRSLSVISAESYLQGTPAHRAQFAERMAVDLVPFGQMACSSPHVVFWLGAPESTAAAMRDFETYLQPAMAAKSGEPDLSRAVRRLNHAFDAVAEGKVKALQHSPHTTQTFVDGVAKAEAMDSCGGGLLIHAGTESLAVLQSVLRRDHQTITHHGLRAIELEELAGIAGRAGVDRVVPAGRALDFGPFWDGYNLWDDLVRILVVQ
jgi:hypothetical protein